MRACPPPSSTPVDLNALVSDVLQLYAQRRKPRWCPVVAELDPEAPPIRGDAQQLRQVIHNLLQNAQDAQEGRQERTA